MSRLRIAALAATFVTPAVIAVATAASCPGTDCAGHVSSTASLLMAAGFPLAASANPYRAFAASLAYLPLGYSLSERCCRLPPDRCDVSVDLFLPFLLLYLLFATFVGGALLRLIVHSFTATPQRPYRPSEPEP